MSVIKDPKNEFLLGLSLSEISFVYFVLLLLISLFMINKSNKTIKNLESHRDNLTSIIEQQVLLLEEGDRLIGELSKNLGVSKENLNDTLTKLVDMRKLQEEVYILRKNLTVLDNYTSVINKIETSDLNPNEVVTLLDSLGEYVKSGFSLDKIEQDLESLEEITEAIGQSEIDSRTLKDISSIVQNYAEKGVDGEQIRKDIENLEMLNQIILEDNKISSIEELLMVNESLNREIEYNKSKMKNGLWDLPPCFIRDGKNAYIYSVEIYENKIDVSPEWPEDKKTIVASIDGSIMNGKKTFGISEFKKFGSTHKKHAQANRCHHYVKVYDKTEPTSKRIWKSNLKLVEMYFYKLEMNNDR